jgi:hypothetical protein
MYEAEGNDELTVARLVQFVARVSAGEVEAMGQGSGGLGKLKVR